MLIVQNCIISDDLADCCFCCDLARCKGKCCVEGDSGAPLEKDEVVVLESIFPQVKPFMTQEGVAAVERQGVAVVDVTGDTGTPLVDGRECAFVVWDGDGNALCAIELAYRQGLTDFKKPISCHLYPLRIEQYGTFQAVNYHRWDVCRCAVEEGGRHGVPLYVYLKEPLVRKYGEAWYEELLAEIRQRQRQQ